MNNPLQRYTNKKILILDDFAEFRLSLRQMLLSFGANHVDVCTTTDEAIALYSEFKHEILLVDFNLGDGLNGLQLLAELNHRGILQYGTIFILITGETATNHVMGALEYRPDDYLAKPFTKTTLKSRLDKLVDRAASLSPIYSALNNEKPKRALELCDQLLTVNKRLTMHCLRIKADIYLKQLNYKSALSIYNTILSSRELSWAQMGAAICHLALQQSEQALSLCKNIVSKNPNAVEAYDLACECFIQLQDYESAYNITQQAIQRSPNSIVRQRALAQLAARYNELDTAFTAYKKVIDLAKFSCLIQLDDYVEQLIVCSKIHLKGHVNATKKAIKEYAPIHKAINNMFPSRQSQLITSFHSAFTDFIKLKDEVARTKLLALCDEIIDFPDPIKPCLVNLLDFISSHELLTDVKRKLDRLLTEAKGERVTRDDQEKSDNFNRQGMVKYQEKDYEQALKAFSTALASAPENINIALNVLQAAYQLNKKQDTFKLSKRQFALAYQALKSLSPQDHRYKQSVSLISFAKSNLAGQK